MFGVFIVKLTGFCNLNCSYCYMFNSADRSFERKPKYLDRDVALAALRRIGSHVGRGPTKKASIVLHGGEPTLWPLESFQAFFDEIERLRDGGIACDVSMQTNMWQRPSRALMELCRRHRVGLGISLDGPLEINDLYRQDFAGHGSYRKIIANVQALLDEGYGDVIGGFLCVMQPAIAPAAFVQWVAGLPMSRVDLLWPLQFNKVHTPWAAGGEAPYTRDPKYGKWAEEVFEAWWSLDRPDIHIRMFNDAIEARLGGGRSTDMMGALAFHSLVINTDGDIEMSDYFRTSIDGGCATGYSVLRDDLEAVARDSRFAAMKRAAETAPRRCRSCKHLGICGGGTLAGRLDAAGNVTAEPSVLCADHMRLFDTIARRVDEAVAA
ncbi:MAG: radical SAM protein [Proteobacteria bacterium]|nr:radical SAM protein [Pseudomonadota bacterium]